MWTSQSTIATWAPWLHPNAVKPLCGRSFMSQFLSIPHWWVFLCRQNGTSVVFGQHPEGDCSVLVNFHWNTFSIMFITFVESQKASTKLSYYVILIWMCPGESSGWTCEWFEVSGILLNLSDKQPVIHAGPRHQTPRYWYLLMPVDLFSVNTVNKQKCSSCLILSQRQNNQERVWIFYSILSTCQPERWLMNWTF